VSGASRPPGAGSAPVEAASPNFGERRGGARPELVVIHHTAMASAEAALARLRDPTAEVSAHWLIAEDGRVWRLVDEAARAWHAGRGEWRGRGDVNSRSIGVELANAGPLEDFPPFPEPQMAALEALLDGIRARWGIGPEGVIGHSDMAPGRKADPGPKFDWRRLALGGRALWPAPVPAPVPAAAAAPDWRRFAAAATRAGYGVAEAGCDAVLDAVRLRFRPAARGAPLAAEDLAMLEGLGGARA